MAWNDLAPEEHKNNLGKWNDLTPEEHEYSHKKTPRKKYSKNASSSMGIINGFTLSHAGEIGGALQTATSPSQWNDLGTNYRKNRDELEQEFAKAHEDNPTDYTGSEIVGAIANPLNPFKGPSLLAKGANAFALGGLYGSGSSKADLTKGEFGEYAGDVGLNGLTGLAVHKAITVPGRASKILSEGSDFAKERAVKAVTGGGSLANIRAMAKTRRKDPGDIDVAQKHLRKVGDDALQESELMGYVSRSKDMAPELGKLRKHYGKLIGEVGDQIDNAAPHAVDAKNIAKNIRDYADDLPNTYAPLKKRLHETAEIYDDITRFNFKEADKYKQSHKFEQGNNDALISNQDASNKVRQIVSEEIEDTVERLAKQGKVDPDLLEKFLRYKGKYGSFKQLSNAATDRWAKDLNNRIVAPSDYGMASAVGVAKAAIGKSSPEALAAGIGAGMINKTVRGRGNSFMARTLYDVEKAYQSKGAQSLRKILDPIFAMAEKGEAGARKFVQTLYYERPEIIQEYEFEKSLSPEQSTKVPYAPEKTPIPSQQDQTPPSSSEAELSQTYGPQATKTVMESEIPFEKFKGTPYIRSIMAAALRGPKALAVTHYLLSQTDPGYSKAQASP